MARALHPPLVLAAPAAAPPAPVVVQTSRQALAVERRNESLPGAASQVAVQRSVGVGGALSGLFRGALAAGGGVLDRDAQSRWNAHKAEMAQRESAKLLDPAQLGAALDQLEPRQLRRLAARLYPHISQRIKVELGRDRERAGMVTGLHR